MIRFIVFLITAQIYAQSLACICLPPDDPELYFKHEVVFKGRVQKIEIDSIYWRIELIQVEDIKSESYSEILIPVGVQQSSCSVPIHEDENWLFFFHTDEIDSLPVLRECSGSRNLKFGDFDLEDMYDEAFFTWNSLPDSTMIRFVRDLNHETSKFLKQFATDSLVCFEIKVDNNGIIKEVQFDSALMYENDKFKHVKYPKQSTEAIIALLTGKRVTHLFYNKRKVNAKVNICLPSNR